MKTKLVYVLISDNNDYYLEQLYISMISARYYMPDVKIEVLTDVETSNTFKGFRKKQISLADKIQVVNIDNKYNKKCRSRILKTSVRNHLNGDFLFIDCDTIIVKSLSSIDKYSFSIAATWDSHSLLKDNPYKDMCISHGKILGWPIEEEEVYYNTGIIFVKDNQQAKDFYARWNDNWLRGHEKKIYMDQPSFAQTNYELGHPVMTIEPYWNCEFKHGVKYLKNAFIVHYLCTNRSVGEQPFILNKLEVFEELKADQRISSSVMKTIEDPFNGISNITLLCAGLDVYQYNKPQFILMRGLTSSFMIALIEKVSSVIILLIRFFKKLSSH